MNYPDPAICDAVCPLYDAIAHADAQFDAGLGFLQHFVPIKVSLPAEPQNPRLG